jgi:hypothetical protein
MSVRIYTKLKDALSTVNTGRDIFYLSKVNCIKTVLKISANEYFDF